MQSVRPDLCYVRVLKPVWMLARACRSEGVPWVYNAYFLPHVAVVDVAAMDPVSLVDAANVLMTVDSVKKIEEWLA